MKCVGNKKANEYYEHCLDPWFLKIDQLDFIKRKYDKKEWVERSQLKTFPRTKNLILSRRPTNKYDRQAVQLQNMGFTNITAVLNALAKTKGDVNLALEELLNSDMDDFTFREKDDTSSSKLKQLKEMGFGDTQKVLQALHVSGGDLEQAVEMLIHTRNSPTPKGSLSPSSSIHNEEQSTLLWPDIESTSKEFEVTKSTRETKKEEILRIFDTLSPPSNNSGRYLSPSKERPLTDSHERNFLAGAQSSPSTSDSREGQINPFKGFEAPRDSYRSDDHIL
ncbi:uncharacterized protein LOC135122146 [Zophobas morio]|uniref:uncharacterized protein LOC135122146 n=1 Tax=Zophobas morio TaxID=2755281 RepID=UPI003082D675